MARTRRSPEQWQQLIEAQGQSGLTISQFCAEHQLTESNFYLYRKRYLEQTQPTAPAKNAAPWLALNELVNVSQEQRRWQIELTLPGGVVLNMCSES